VRPPSNTASSPFEPKPSLSQIIQWFKSMTTNDYIRGVKVDGWPSFNKRLWQRNYHDHVIRNDRDLDRIRAYIEGNPARWPDDPENPAIMSDDVIPTRGHASDERQP
ncbi:MAG: transposase, partial [Thermomicrobiales bacterium]